MVGHLFQGRFKSPVIDVDEYLLSCGRYVERNPVSAGLLSEPWQYRWSSCRAYALGEADGLLAAKRWYDEKGATVEQRCQRWREFLLGEDGKQEVVERGDWTIGGEEFRQRMQKPGARARPRGRGRPVQPTPRALADAGRIMS